MMPRLMVTEFIRFLLYADDFADSFRGLFILVPHSTIEEIPIRILLSRHMAGVAETCRPAFLHPDLSGYFSRYRLLRAICWLYRGLSEFKQERPALIQRKRMSYKSYKSHKSHRLITFRLPVPSAPHRLHRAR